MRYMVRKLGLGGILDESLVLFRDHFAFILPASLLIVFVPELFSEVVSKTVLDESKGTFGLGITFLSQFAAVELPTVASTLLEAVLACGIVQLLHEDSVHWGKAVKQTVACWPSLLMLILIWTFVVALASAFLTLGSPLLGLIAGIVLVYLGVRWFVAVQAVVVEDYAGAESLTRSAQLTKGAKWRCFGLLLLMLLIQIPPTLCLKALLGPMLGLLCASILNSLFVAYFGLCTVLFYFSRRCEKEDFDVEFWVDYADDAHMKETGNTDDPAESIL